MTSQRMPKKAGISSPKRLHAKVRFSSRCLSTLSTGAVLIFIDVPPSQSLALARHPGEAAEAQQQDGENDTDNGQQYGQRTAITHHFILESRNIHLQRQDAGSVARPAAGHYPDQIEV